VERDYPFDEPNIYTVLGAKLDLSLLQADMLKYTTQPIENWTTVSHEGDAYPRYQTVSVSDHILEYLEEMFVPKFNPKRVGWFIIPAHSIGPFHYDKWRNTSINLDMKVDTGAGLFFFENNPETTGRVIKVDYPDDKLVMLNVREGHMIINESPEPRVMLTISFNHMYHDLLDMMNQGVLYRE